MEDKEQGRAEALYDEQLQRQKQEKQIEDDKPPAPPLKRGRPAKG